MKKILTLIFILATLIVFGQAPQSFKYQAVARTTTGALIVNQNVGIQISILQGSTAGTAVYVETHATSSNEFGLVNIQIGIGTVQSGTFSSIDWGADTYFVIVEVDETGGSSYAALGTFQLLSVPYALHAKTVENDLVDDADADPINELELPTNAAAGDMVYHNGSGWNKIDAPTGDNKVLTFCGGEPTWTDNGQCPFVCGNDFIDIRDGKSYNTVQIGSQCWMAENLAYLPSVDDPATTYSFTSPYYYVYGYTGTDVTAAKATSNYATYGALYNWQAAMAGAPSSSTVPSGVTGICPSGWHLPSEAEWTQLINFLGGLTVAGGKLKETGTVHWSSPNTSATNSSGFSGLPGGYSFNNGFSVLGNNGYWWSSTDYLTFDGRMQYMLHDSQEITSSYWNRANGCSVRCVKD